MRNVFISLLLIVLALQSCRKSSTANWDVDAVLPVVQSSLNIRHFLGDTLFKYDNTGLLTLSVNRQLVYLKLDSLFAIPDTSIVSSFTVPAITPLQLTPGQAITLFPPSELAFDISNGVKLKKTEVRSCILHVKFSNTLDQPLDLIYQLPNALKNGKPFTISETIPKEGSFLEKDYDLSGYVIDLRGQNGNVYNTILQTYTMLVSNSASGPTTAYYGDGARVELTYSKIQPQYIEGYFGQQKIDIAVDTARFGLDQNFRAKNFMLSEASLGFKLYNEFGAEFGASIFNLNAINSADGKTVTLTQGALSNLNINRATHAATGGPLSSEKDILLNGSNSNIVPFISCLPSRLTYQGSIFLNPLGNISSYNDFAYYNTGVRLVADINIPMRFNADYFVLTTSAKTDFSGVKQLDKVKGGSFIFKVTNGYPFDAELQAYLMDESDRIVDSLYTAENVVRRGTIDAQNEVTNPVESNIYVPVTREKIEHLKQCRHIKITAKFIVPPGPPDVKIKESYALDTKIIAELTYNVSGK